MALLVKNLPANVGDVGSIPGSARSPGEGNGNPLHYSCLGNPMDRGARRAAVHGVQRSDRMERAHTRVHKLNAEICTVTQWCPIYPMFIGNTQMVLLLS